MNHRVTDIEAKALLKIANQQERRALLPLLKEAGSQEYTRRIAIEYIQQAKKELQILSRSTARDTSKSLTDQVVKRDHEVSFHSTRTLLGDCRTIQFLSDKIPL